MHAKRTWKETFVSIGIAGLVLWRRLVEGIEITLFYYLRSWTFFRVDTKLLITYWKESPFSISRRYLEAQGAEEIDIYGETPLTTMDLIATAAGLGPNDVVYELGCGRGRACFWLRLFVGCQVVGLEYIPEFVFRAQELQQSFQMDRIHFEQKDFLHASLKGATCIYLYGTTLEERAIKKLILHLSHLPSGTQIITVSYPLQDYCDYPYFLIEKQLTLPFLWGEADVYIQCLSYSNK